MKKIIVLLSLLPIICYAQETQNSGDDYVKKEFIDFLDNRIIEHAKYKDHFRERGGGEYYIYYMGTLDAYIDIRKNIQENNK